MEEFICTSQKHSGAYNDTIHIEFCNFRGALLSNMATELPISQKYNYKPSCRFFGNVHLAMWGQQVHVA